MANEFNIKNGFITSGNSNVYANLNVTGGLTASTISASTYNNLPSFSGGSVTGLTVNGNLTVTGNTSLQALTATTISATTISASTVTTSFTTGSVIFQGSGGILSQNNSNFFWDNVNTGLVLGGGSLDSNYILQVNGTKGIRISGTGTGYGYSLVRGTEFSSFANNGSAGVFVSTTALQFLTAGITKMSIGASGNVIIQNGGAFTDAGFRLDVSGTTRVVSNIYANSGVNVGGTSTTAGIFVQAGSTLNRETIAIRGGLLTTDVGNDIILSNGQGNATITSGTRAIVSISRGFAPTSGTGVFNTTVIEPPINQTGGANGITRGLFINPTITSASDFRALETTVGNVILNGTSGNTIIGKTTDSGQKLQVSGNTLIQGGLTATTFSGNSDTISGTKGSVITDGSSTTAFLTFSGSNTIGGTGYTDFIRVTNTATGATNPNKTFRTNNTGALEIVNSTYGTIILSLTDAGVLSTPGGGTSDLRRKTNIQYIDDEITPHILNLKPVKFEYKDYSGTTRHGFIAQDVLETYPELVLGDGEKENGTYGLDYDGILSLTVKSLQETILKVEKLEKELNELKNKMG
jgi:hypothetical protein